MAEKTPLHDVELQAGAVFREEAGWLVPGHFGDVLAEYRQACDGAVVFDLSHRGLIEAKGKDAVRWLNNLCTNDIVNLGLGHWCEAFLTTNKAKAVAYGYVYRVGHEKEPGLWFSVDPGMAETVLKHLDHYLISEQVELADRSRDYVQLHLAGPQAASTQDKLMEQVRNAARDKEIGPDFSLQSFAHNLLCEPGYDIYCTPISAEKIWEGLRSAGAKPAGIEAYELLRVEAGVPVFGKDIDEERFVVEVNRIPQTICYTKGCYLGQEPIVMARDRGHVNRKLLGVTFGEGGPLPHGAKLFHEGTEAGEITSSVVSPRFRAIALAYIRRGHDTPGTKLEVEVEGSKRAGTVTALPFAGFGTLG
jgi:folate-binding protein YgfZ